MRQLINLDTQTCKVDVNKLSDTFIREIGYLLNTKEMAHIDTIYFTKDGKWYINAYDYKGQDKKMKGKKFARFAYQNTLVKDATGRERWVRQSHPVSEFEIIKEYDAADIVNMYIKLIKK